MAVNINGDTGIDKIQTGAVDSSDIADNSIGADKLNVTGNGTADQVLKSQGDGTFSWGDAGGGGLTGDELFTASGTWTKPAGVNTAYVTVVGGGGGGGGRGHYNNAVSGTGGNAGGVAFKVVDVSNVNTVAVTVGGGGAGGGNNHAVGGTGGTSSFGSYVSATGGSGGYGGNTVNAALNRIGGIGSGGTWNIRGDQSYWSHSGASTNSSIHECRLGAGGSYGLGGMQATVNDNNGRRNAQGYGAGGMGGSGIINTDSRNNSSAGTGGAVYIRY